MIVNLFIFVSIPGQLFEPSFKTGHVWKNYWSDGLDEFLILKIIIINHLVVFDDQCDYSKKSWLFPMIIFKEISSFSSWIFMNIVYDFFMNIFMINCVRKIVHD